MKQEIISVQIRNLSEMIQEQTETILAHQNRIPQIELDLLLGNLRKLYEALIELQRIQNRLQGERQSMDQVVARTVQQEESQIIAEPNPVAAPPAAKNEVAEEIKSSVIALMETEPMAEVSEEHTTDGSQSEPAAATPIVKPSPIAETTESILKSAKTPAKPTATLFDEPHTVADRFEEAHTLHDKFIQPENDKSIGSKMQHAPVSDLKKFIGINDKFAFINDLFEGNLSAYNEAIERLNQSAGLNDAMAYFEKDLQNKYSWSSDNKTAQHLRNLVERRFL